ncbi:hypothetical protein Micbo1qcDRAFT_174932 [Microdochium bolleyi]|uniref:Uncharacterized protein n=1 Tax=Microdochium bolleyi TaxID=196109 RepID=A0A136J499_9PEZI|nr:hypothetical protein Micbo1qcDRAFT_174932 [Microdochium bolleyi]
MAWARMPLACLSRRLAAMNATPGEMREWRAVACVLEKMSLAGQVEHLDFDTAPDKSFLGQSSSSLTSASATPDSLCKHCESAASLLTTLDSISSKMTHGRNFLVKASTTMSEVPHVKNRHRFTDKITKMIRNVIIAFGKSGQ